MRLAAHNFRGHVAGCSGRVLAVVGVPDARDSQISDPEVTHLVEDQIFGFNIAVKDTVSMQEFETEDHTGDEKFSLLFTESSVLANMVPQITTLHEIDHQVEIVTVLEGVVHVNEEWMVQLAEELFLVHH